MNESKTILYADDVPLEEQGGLRETWWRQFGPLRWYAGREEMWMRLGPFTASWNMDTATKRLRRLDAARAK